MTHADLSRLLPQSKQSLISDKTVDSLCSLSHLESCKQGGRAKHVSISVLRGFPREKSMTTIWKRHRMAKRLPDISTISRKSRKGTEWCIKIYQNVGNEKSDAQIVLGEDLLTPLPPHPHTRWMFPPQRSDKTNTHTRKHTQTHQKSCFLLEISKAAESK